MFRVEYADGSHEVVEAEAVVILANQVAFLREDGFVVLMVNCDTVMRVEYIADVDVHAEL